MLVNEYLSNQNNVFELLYTNHPELNYLEPFEYINTMLKLNSGGKTLFIQFENVPAELLAEMLYLNYQEKWVALSDLTSLDITASEKETVTEIKNREVGKSGTENTTNKTVGFNDSVFIDTGGDEKTVNDNVADDSNSSKETIKSNLADINNNLQIIKNISKIREVISDVTNFISLTIYRN